MGSRLSLTRVDSERARVSLEGIVVVPQKHKIHRNARRSVLNYVLIECLPPDNGPKKSHKFLHVSLPHGALYLARTKLASGQMQWRIKM